MVRGHLSNIRVLTKPALEIASDSRNGIGPAAGQKMEKRFLFNRVDISGNHFSVHKRFQGSGKVFPDIADPPFARLDDAPMIAETAFYALIL
jgi:hypothetical protein